LAAISAGKRRVTSTKRPAPKLQIASGSPENANAAKV